MFPSQQHIIDAIKESTRIIASVQSGQKIDNEILKGAVKNNRMALLLLERK